MCSLNIQGLKKYIRNETVLAFCSQYDIVGLSETWQTTKDEFNDFLTDSYIKYDCPRPSRNSRGSGGVSVFIKSSLHSTGLIKRIYSEFKDCVVLFIDKQLTGFATNIILFYVYVAPENSVMYDGQPLNGIEILSEQLRCILSDLQGISFIVAGDLNSRVGDMLDFIPDDNIDHVFNSDVQYPGDQFNRPRRNCDTHSNRFGKSLIDMCCEFNMHICNGRSSRDYEGNCTCTANGGKSVVDYFLASTCVFDFISDFGVEDFDMSDHFPLTCCLKMLNAYKCDFMLNESELNLQQHLPFKWKEPYKRQFLDSFVPAFRSMTD